MADKKIVKNNQQEKSNAEPPKSEQRSSDAPLTNQKSSEEKPQELSEIDTLKAKIAELEKSVELYKDQFLRKAADFENYKRRVENEYLTVTRFANENLITELLPVLDDFARSLKISKERREFGPFYKGVELIYTKLLKILEAQGLTAMQSLGKEFNVDYHEALMQMPKDDIAPQTIIEEAEKGYFLRDKVIRHAKVVVASKPETEPTDHEEQTQKSKKDESENSQ